MVQHFTGSLPDPSSHILLSPGPQRLQMVSEPATPTLNSPAPISLPASSLMCPFIYLYRHVVTTQHIQMCPCSCTPPASLLPHTQKMAQVSFSQSLPWAPRTQGITSPAALSPPLSQRGSSPCASRHHFP